MTDNVTTNPTNTSKNESFGYLTQNVKRNEPNNDLKALRDFINQVVNYTHDWDNQYKDIQNIEAVLNARTPDQPCLPLKKFSAQETNGRTWQSISPIEFAAWAGALSSGTPNERSDHNLLLDVLLKYVPDEKIPEALEQLKEVRKYGTEHGPVMSPYLRLTKMFEEQYYNFINNVGNNNRVDFETNAIQKIGFHLLPLYARTLYDHDSQEMENRYLNDFKSAYAKRDDGYPSTEIPHAEDYGLPEPNFLDRFKLEDLFDSNALQSEPYLQAGLVMDKFYQAKTKSLDGVIANLENKLDAKEEQRNRMYRQ